MRTTLLLALLAVGCYSPSYRDCEITCVSGACPSGLSCREGVCRAEGQIQSCAEVLGDARGDTVIPIDALPDGSPDVDTDMDGLNDSVDNCRFIGNADQLNEDNDGFGDVCDPCPPYRLTPNTNLDANLDPDADGVGDGCDPNPTTTGDRLLFFVGFKTAQGATFQGQGAAAWTFNGAASANVPSGTYANAVWPVALLQPDRRETLVAQMRVLQFNGGGNQDPGASVIDNLDASGRGVSCFRGLINGPAQLALTETNSADEIIHGSTPTTIPPSDTAAIRLAGNGTSSEFLCSGAGVQVPLGLIPTIGGTNLVGIHVRNAHAAFDWFMVVDSPP